MIEKKWRRKREVKQVQNVITYSFELSYYIHNQLNISK